MGFLDHKELKLVCGVYRAPGDNNSVEASIFTLNLLDTAGGISLQSWSPNMPSLEQSGIWTDSPLSVGRMPLVLNESNVTETLRLTINGGNMLASAKKLAELMLMIENAREFWTDNAQTEPVYLHWFASCGAGKQYALIYNMDFKPEYGDSQSAIITGSLVIEREPYWRFIPPGANPKQWTYEYNNQPYGMTVFNGLNPTQIGAFADQLIYAPTIQNKSEFNSGSQSLLTGNFVTIPAASIPGDAPALLQFYLNTSDTTRRDIMIGKKTRKITLNSTNIAQNTIINANSGTLGTDATLVNDTGAVKDAGAANAQRVRISFATASNSLRWDLASTGIGQAMINRFIGRWNIFLRCRQINGSLGDITMYLRYGSSSLSSDTGGIKLNVVNPPVIGTSGASTDWGLVYMGCVTIPITPSKAAVNGGGLTTQSNGLDGTSNYSPFNIGLYASKVAGTQELYLCDFIFMPIDEGIVQLEHQETAGSGNHIYDATGYYTHGTPDLFVTNSAPAGTVRLDQFTGTGIQLTPGVENRLYFVCFDSSKQSRPSDTWEFYGNIIPRCRGIRTYSNLAGASASG